MKLLTLSLLSLMMTFRLCAQETKELTFYRGTTFMVEKGEVYFFKFKAEKGKEYTISYIDSDDSENTLADIEPTILKADKKTKLIGEEVDLNALGNSFQKGQKIKAGESMEVYIKIEGKSAGSSMVTVTPMM